VPLIGGDAGASSEPWLASIEARDNIFPDIDDRLYVR
jgi:hypothetical protein